MNNFQVQKMEQLKLVEKKRIMLRTQQKVELQMTVVLSRMVVLYVVDRHV
jgi:hypothetical protein